MISLVLAATLAAAAPVLERVPTRCSVIQLPGSGFATDLQLIGCGTGFPDNVLWNLDRADDVIDSYATRAARGRGVVVYVLDTGVEASHDEMLRDDGTSKVIAGLEPGAALAESQSSTSCPSDSPTHPCYTDSFLGAATHGTAVASVVAGRDTGVAPDASIVSVRTLTNLRLRSGFDSNDVWLEALDEVVAHAFASSTPQFRTAIINMSSTPSFSSATDAKWLKMKDKMLRMIGGIDANGNADPNGKHFLFVSAAGNNTPASTVKTMRGQCALNNNVFYFPAAAGSEIDGLITAGGVDRENREWSQACGGPAVDVLAPADTLLVASITGHDHYRGTLTYPDGSVQDVTSGTSYSAPYVCGIAARMLELDPTLTPVELEAKIKANASYVANPSTASAGGRVAVLRELPPPSGPKRRSASH